MLKLCSLAFLTTCTVAGLAAANTSVHSYDIPTVGAPQTATIAVCGALPTGALGWAGGVGYAAGTRRYGAALCLPVPNDTGPRPFVVPQEVADAIERVEYSLVAHFKHDSTDVENDKEALPAANVIVAWLKTHPDAGLRVSGYTDATGSSAYNHNLSERRAAAVKSFFVARGVEEERIEISWYGEDSLVLQVAGRERKNRRVEIEVIRLVEAQSE